MIRGIILSVDEGVIKYFSSSTPFGNISGRELFQHYGFTSRALNGAENIIINKGNHYISIAEDDRRYRIAIENGEVALYTDEGDYIKLSRNKIINVVSGGTVNVNSPSIILGSQGTTYHLIDERLIALYDNHTHGSDGKPVVKLAASAVKTAITQAG